MLRIKTYWLYVNIAMYVSSQTVANEFLNVHTYLDGFFFADSVSDDLASND